MWKTRKNPQSFPRLMVAETLELRRMLSSALPIATPADLFAVPADGTVSGSASPSGYTPTQIKDAYGINSISFNGVVGTGAGQTIAIVDATDNPDFVDSTDPNFDNSDLHKFDVAMGLADPPSFVKVNYDGTTNYPAPQTEFGWANEIALDVEWTHAIAPQANILLVEVPIDSANAFGLLGGAVNYARNVAGVSVVTMSFALPEVFGESQYDQYLTTPTGHAGVTFLAATGDDGDPGGYPAFSPNVVAVGATALTLSNSDTGDSYVSEVGHNTSGGGISQDETKPTYQYGVTLSSTMRTIPDVSFDGDQDTGVPVYNSYDAGSSTPWYKEGGTSFSTPAWGALIAIADQGRATVGLTSLDGPSQTLPRLYELDSSDYHDITSGTTVGSVSVSAGPGYDLVTGLGTPIANLLVPDLAGGNTVSGTVFNDVNDNGQLNNEEPGLSGFSNFVDLYGTTNPKGADPEVTSTANGLFSFTDLPGGTYHISQITPAGWVLTTSSAGYTVTLGFDSTVTGKNFGYDSNGDSAQVVFSQQPSEVGISTTISPAITVAITDSSGNVVTTDNSAVTLSVTGGTVSLTGSLTELAVDGIATFNDISIATAGTYTLQATDGSLASATSDSFTVDAAPAIVATRLVFGQQVATASVGSSIIPGITVFLESPNGDVVSTDQSAVTIALAAGSTANAPTGALTVNAVNGIATFSNIIFESPGSASLIVTDGTLTPATSNTFSAVVVASLVRFVQQPTSAGVGTAITPPIVVDVEDLYGNLVTTNDSPVSLAVTGGAATIGGTSTVNAVNGVATFNNVTIPSAGTFTLNATDGTLNGALSDSFTVLVPGTITPTIKRSTLLTSYIAGTKVRAAVSVNQTSTVAVSDGLVTTNAYAVAGDGTLTLLGHYARSTTLKAGRIYPVNVPITTVPVDAGTYAIQVQTTDPAGDTNVVSAGTLVIAPRIIALNAVFTRLTLLDSVVSGSVSHAVATLRITNSGNITSTGATVAIFASLDGLTTDAIQIASLSLPRLSIAAKRSGLVSVSLKTIPAGLDGNYTILAEVIDPNAVVTSVSSNSVVTIAPPTITLAGSLTAAPVTITAGRAVTYTLKLSNSGNVPSTGLASINVGLSSDGTTEIAGSTTLPARLVTFPNGRTIILRLRVTIPATTTAAMYFPFISFSQGGDSITVIGTTAITVG